MTVRIEEHDSLLGHWVLARWDPPPKAPPPAALVEGVWYFEGTLALLRERHFPHGMAELVVHLGPVYRKVLAPDRTEPFPELCLSGLMLAPDVIEAPGNRSAVLGIRLRPGGLFSLLGHAVHELTGETVALEDVAGCAARELQERCRRASDAGGRVREAIRWLDRELSAASRLDPAVAWTAGAIRAREGRVAIGDLQDATGSARSRFTATFREQIGIAPKALARIHRFRRALRMVGGTRKPLVDVALDAGYYDQSHFTNEFRSLSGFTPGEYRHRTRFPGSESLAESAPGEGDRETE